jgi:hypothetical protein
MEYPYSALFQIDGKIQSQYLFFLNQPVSTNIAKSILEVKWLDLPNYYTATIYTDRILIRMLNRISWVVLLNVRDDFGSVCVKAYSKFA